MRTPSRSTRRLATFALLSSLTIAACNAKHADNRQTASSPAPVSFAEGRAVTTKTDASATGTVGVDRPVDASRKVIRTGRIDLVVATYDDARTKLDALLKAAGGYIDSTHVAHHQGAVSSATLVLRIPSGAFASILPQLRELGQIASEATNAEDITDQYVDIAARLASARTLEKRLLELASTKTTSVEALLSVERELARVRGEIESYEGRLRQWNDQVDMSTLTLGLATRAPAIAAPPDPTLGDRISEGFAASIDSLEDMGSWLAVTGVSILPWLVLVIPGLLLGRRALRRIALRLPPAVARTAPPPPPSQSSPMA